MKKFSVLTSIACLSMFSAASFAVPSNTAGAHVNSLSGSVPANVLPNKNSVATTTNAKPLQNKQESNIENFKSAEVARIGKSISATKGNSNTNSNTGTQVKKINPSQQSITISSDTTVLQEQLETLQAQLDMMQAELARKAEYQEIANLNNSINSKINSLENKFVREDQVTAKVDTLVQNNLDKRNLVTPASLEKEINDKLAARIDTILKKYDFLTTKDKNEIVAAIVSAKGDAINAADNTANAKFVTPEALQTTLHNKGYLTATDRASLTNAIATAKTDAIATAKNEAIADAARKYLTNEKVDANFLAGKGILTQNTIDSELVKKGIDKTTLLADIKSAKEAAIADATGKINTLDSRITSVASGQIDTTALRGHFDNFLADEIKNETTGKFKGFLTTADKTSLTNAIATAKGEVIADAAGKYLTDDKVDEKFLAGKGILTTADKTSLTNAIATAKGEVIADAAGKYLTDDKVDEKFLAGKGVLTTADKTSLTNAIATAKGEVIADAAGKYLTDDKVDEKFLAGKGILTTADKTSLANAIATAKGEAIADADNKLNLLDKRITNVADGQMDTTALKGHFDTFLAEELKDETNGKFKDYITGTLLDKRGFLTGSDVDTRIAGKGFLTGSDITKERFKFLTNDDIKSFITNDDVENTIRGKGFLTGSDVDTRIAGKGFLTGSDVDARIAGKGFLTGSDITKDKLGFLTSSDITKSKLGFLTSDDVTASKLGYLTSSSDLSGKFAGYLDTELGKGVNGKFKDYVTNTALGNKGFLTGSDITKDKLGFLTSSDITKSKLGFLTSDDVTASKLGYLTSSSDLSGKFAGYLDTELGKGVNGKFKDYVTNTALGNKGFLTGSDVDTRIAGKGFLTSSDITKDKLGFLTSDDVTASKLGYLTANSDLSGKFSTYLTNELNATTNNKFAGFAKGTIPSESTIKGYASAQIASELATSGKALNTLQSTANSAKSTADTVSSNLANNYSTTEALAKAISGDNNVTTLNGLKTNLTNMRTSLSSLSTNLANLDTDIDNLSSSVQLKSGVTYARVPKFSVNP